MEYTDKKLWRLVKESLPNQVTTTIENLLKNGANPNITDPDLGDISMLMFAISIENLELMKLLIRYQADINHENNVLVRCLFNNFMPGFELLISRPDLSSASIGFALFTSILRNERINFTRKLVETFPDICLNAFNSQGKSALEFSLVLENVEAIQLLNSSKNQP